MNDKIPAKEKKKDPADTRYSYPIDSTDSVYSDKRNMHADKLLGALLLSSPAAIMVLDTDYNVIRWSSSCENLFGWAEEQVLGKFPPIISGEKEKQFKMLLKKGLSGISFVDMQLNTENKDGLMIDISLSTSPLRDADGKVFGLIGVMIDASERKKTENELRKSEETFRLMFDQSLFGVAILSMYNRFLKVNSQFCELTDYTEEELIGKELFKVMDPDDVGKASRIIESLRGGEIDRCQIAVRYLRKDRDTVWVRLSVQIICDSKGKGVYYILVMEDITDRKVAEEVLKLSENRVREQEQVLQQKNIALKELMKQVELEKQRIKDDLHVNISSLLDPVLKQLMLQGVSHKYTDLIYKHLDHITSSFGRNITGKDLDLTSREIEICGLIKGGLTSKEISKILNVSYQTIEKHRKNIRRKLKINSKSINLTSYLKNI